MKPIFLVSLKVLLAAALGVVIIHFWPMAALPVILGLFFGLCLLVIFLICLAAVAGVGGGVMIGLLALVLALLALFSPLLIPVALVLGIIWLVKKLSHVPARPTAAA
jgi:hypothetical protein